MTTTTEFHTLTVHEKAVETIEDMRRQTVAAADAWQPHRPDKVLAMVTSLADQLAKLFSMGFGDLRLFRDGDLNLLGQSGITFGLIFHRLDRPDAPREGDIRLRHPAPYEGRYCGATIEGPEGASYCLKPYQGTDRHPYESKPTCTGHVPWLVILPVLGEWSFHS